MQDWQASPHTPYTSCELTAAFLKSLSSVSGLWVICVSQSDNARVCHAGAEAPPESISSLSSQIGQHFFKLTIHAAGV